MPLTYTCDGCGTSAPTPTGWYVVEVGLFSIVGMPDPTSRGQLAAPLVLYFDCIPCRDAWCATAGVPAPGADA